MSRQNRGGVTDTMSDLSLGEILNVAQARPNEIGFRQLGAAEIRVVKNGVAQICSLEVGPVQARIGKVSPPTYLQLQGWLPIVWRTARKPSAYVPSAGLWGLHLLDPIGARLRLERRYLGWELGKGSSRAKHSTLWDRGAKSQYARNHPRTATRAILYTKANHRAERHSFPQQACSPKNVILT
jgi:hypothetical protein